MTKLLITISVLLFLGSPFANAQSIHFAIKVVDYVADKRIQIVDYVADERWKVVGGCSNSPNLRIQIVDYVADKRIKIVDYVADKRVCITNPEELDEETLRILGLIE